MKASAATSTISHAYSDELLEISQAAFAKASLKREYVCSFYITFVIKTDYVFQAPTDG